VGEAARLAANAELTRATSLRLLDELMEIAIGENLDRAVDRQLLRRVAGNKKSTGTTRGTVKRYKLLVRRKRTANARKIEREN